MRIPLLGTVAALALLLGAAGCGGSHRGAALTRYIDQVDRIEAGLVQPSQDVTAASRQLAKTAANHAKSEATLRAAARKIDVLKARVAAVAPPLDARKLRSLLLDLLGRESALARELADYAAFVPAFAASLAPLVPAGTRLRSVLRAKRSSAASAAALEAYASVVAAGIARLEALRPPPVSAAIRETEVGALRQVRAAAAALAEALSAKRPTGLGALIHRFDVAEAANDTLAAQRSRIAAIRAFNARVAGLQTLAARIQRERGRLQRSLD
jgi:hypothetical protein